MKCLCIRRFHLFWGGKLCCCGCYCSDSSTQGPCKKGGAAPCPGERGFPVSSRYHHYLQVDSGEVGTFSSS